jgi:hypothetical protein
MTPIEPTDPNYPKYHLHIECATLPDRGKLYLDGPHRAAIDPTSITSIELQRMPSVDDRPTLRLILW